MRVLIIHNNPIFCLGLHALFQKAGDIEIIGQTTEAEQMLVITREQGPDVVLFDGNTVSRHPAAYTATELVSRLRQAGARGIFVLAPNSGPIDETEFFAFLKGGAAAFESPNLPGEVLIEKMRCVAAGEHLITSAALQQPAILQAALLELRQASATPPEPQEPTPDKNGPQLSERELEVLDHVKRGLSNKQIAKEMKISDQTVKNHIASILKKTNCSDRTAAVVYALRKTLLFFEDVEGTHVASVSRKSRSQISSQQIVGRPTSQPVSV